MLVEEIKSLLESECIEENDIFNILQSISMLANNAQIDNENESIAQELILRVLDRRENFSKYEEIVNSLLRHFGLFPYLNSNFLNMKDALARAIHRPELYYSTDKKVKGNGIVFHRVQAEIFQKLLNGESIILSAPTSFGKSTLIDALVDSEKYSNIVIVVPTIALIDETRRRLSKFKNIYKIITHISQRQEEKNIFVFTQERVVDYPDFPKLDLFILDEFYKLDPQRDQDRAMILNHAFYKLTKLSRQFYLLGPNINAIPDGFPKKFTCTFVRTDYITVVTEIINVEKSEGLTDLEVLGELCKKIHGETLIFCKSPAQARKIVKYLIDSFEEKTSEAANWVAEHYHPEWSFVRGLKHGIGMHHGKIPRALAQLCVREFNNGQLKFLVCTSTLIEGVNTKAKNIIIFDNKISTKKIDFFTFNNIRGRSGRMFKHFIGNVYLFHPEPYAELPLVDLPIFTQESSNARDSLLIQIDDIDLVPTAKERMEPFKRQRILSMDVIKANSGIEPSIQIRLAEYLKVNTDILEQLIWDQTPSWEELVVLCDLILNFLASSKNGLTDKKLAFQIEQLKKKSIQEIIRDKITYKVEKEEIDVADKAVANYYLKWTAVLIQSGQ